MTESDEVALGTGAKFITVSEWNQIVLDSSTSVNLANVSSVVTARTLDILSARDIGIDVERSMVTAEDIESFQAALDLDMLLIVWKQLTTEFKEHLLTFFPNGNDFINCSCQNTFQILAKNLVNMALDDQWISSYELSQLTPINDTLYKPIVKMPTVGFTKACPYLYGLAAPACADPLYGWVKFNISSLNVNANGEAILCGIELYMQLVRHIAYAFTMRLSPANAVHMMNAFMSESPTLRNTGKSLGGMWVYRLAYIMYQIVRPERCSLCVYVEEAFNMKNRCCNIPIDFNLFSGARIPRTLANSLATKIMENESSTHVSMLQFAALNILVSNILIGVGLQFNAKKKSSDNTYVPMYVAQPHNLQDKKCRASEGSRNYISRKDYIQGALCKGLGGFTEKHIYLGYLLSGLEDIHGGKGKTVPKEIWNIITKQDATTLPVRCQCYYPTFRYSNGESNQPYAERISTKLQMCNSNLDSIEEMYIDANFLARNIEKYTLLASENICMFQEYPMLRQEMAFISNKHKLHQFKPWIKISDKKNILHQLVAATIEDPIQLSIKAAKQNSTFYNLKDIVSFMILNLNAYIYTYKACVIKLQDNIDLHERSAICIFIKFIQDFLALFYSGTTKAQVFKRVDVDKIGKHITNDAYVYSVYLGKLGTVLGRPYSMLPVLPNTLRNHVFRMLINSEETPNLQKRGFVLTQCHTTNHTLRRKTIYEKMLSDGHQCHVLQCTFEECKKCFLTLNLLHEHLQEFPIHRNAYDDSLSICLLPDEAKRLNSSFSLNLDIECTRALSLIREGKSLYISGDAGTGKSQLLRCIMNQLFLIHGDWPRGNVQPTKVFGIAFQGIMCTNLHSSFQTIHHFLEITEPVIPIRVGQVLIDFCLEWLEHPKHEYLRLKLRKMECLLVDEVGKIEPHIGELLVQMLKIARDDDSAFGGVQVILSGQCTQGPPLSDEKKTNKETEQFIGNSWAMNAEVNASTIPIWLEGYKRSEDNTLNDFITRAKLGQNTETDVKTIHSFGSRVSELLTCHNLYGRHFSVTVLCYEHKHRRFQNRSIITEFVERANEFINVRIAMHHSEDKKIYETLGQLIAVDSYNVQVNGKRSDVTEKSLEPVFQLSSETRKNIKCFESINKLVNDPKWNSIDNIENPNPANREIRCRDIEFYEKDISLDEYFKLDSVLYILPGMPLILTRSLKMGQDINRDLKYYLPKGTQGIFKGYHYTGDGDLTCTAAFFPSKEVSGLWVNLNLTSESGKPLKYLYMFKRVESFTKNKLKSCYVIKESSTAMLESAYIVRKQFPFTYGMSVSWLAIQCLTLPYVYLDLQQNELITKKDGMDVHALWLVALSRVRNSKNILVRFPDEKKIKEQEFFLRFFNCVNHQALAFEKTFIDKAKRLTKDYTMKAEHSLALREAVQQQFIDKRLDQENNTLNSIKQDMDTSMYIFSKLIEHARPTKDDELTCSVKQQLQEEGFTKDLHYAQKKMEDALKRYADCGITHNTIEHIKKNWKVIQYVLIALFENYTDEGYVLYRFKRRNKDHGDFDAMLQSWSYPFQEELCQSKSYFGSVGQVLLPLKNTSTLTYPEKCATSASEVALETVKELDSANNVHGSTEVIQKKRKGSILNKEDIKRRRACQSQRTYLHANTNTTNQVNRNIIQVG